MSVTIADDLVRATHLTEDEFLCEIATLLYQHGRLTLGQAGAMAKLPQLKFQQMLASRNITVPYDEQDFADDLDTLRTMRP